MKVVSKKSRGSGFGEEPGRSVSIRDIAARAGVSAAAVSKALNNKPDISVELRKKIFTICDRLNYRVNPNIQDLARSNGANSTRNIAFVIVGKMFSDPAYAKIIDGIFKAARDNNLNLLLDWMSGEDEHIYELSAILRERRVDGIIITGSLNYRVINVLKKLAIPHVILGTYDKSLTASSVNVRMDMGMCIEAVVSSIAERGKKRIAYLAKDSDNYFQQEMLAAFKAACGEHGVVVNDEIIYYSNRSFPEILEELEDVFKLPSLPFDSIVTPNFRLALAVSHLVMARYGVGGRPDIIIGTLRNSEKELLPVPTVYAETCFDRTACEGVKELINIISEKTEFRPKRITLSPDGVRTEL